MLPEGNTHTRIQECVNDTPPHAASVACFLSESEAYKTHQQRPLISDALSCGGSGIAGCCWVAAPVSGARGLAAQTAAARLGSTSWTGSEQRNPLWQPLLTELTGSCWWSSGRCRPPAGAASMRRLYYPGGRERRKDSDLHLASAAFKGKLVS